MSMNVFFKPFVGKDYTTGGMASLMITLMRIWNASDGCVRS